MDTKILFSMPSILAHRGGCLPFVFSQQHFKLSDSPSNFPNVRRLIISRHFACRKQFAFSLVEVLITLVILSIGLLGLASLQLHTLQSSHIAYQRALANIIAIDAAERLWAELSTGSIEIAKVEQAWLEFWQSSDMTLPDLAKDSSITCSAANYCTISVHWDERRLQTQLDESAGSFVYEIALLPNHFAP